MKIRIVPSQEMADCPQLRFDVIHYIPIHRVWECNFGSKLRTKQALVKAWLDGKITSEMFELARKYV